MPDRGIFRATTDQMFDFLEQIQAHERAKQESPMGSPEFVQEARNVERLQPAGLSMGAAGAPDGPGGRRVASRAASHRRTSA